MAFPADGNLHVNCKFGSHENAEYSGRNLVVEFEKVLKAQCGINVDGKLFKQDGSKGLQVIMDESFELNKNKKKRIICDKSEKL